MNQPVPEVTRNDVERVVRRDFGEEACLGVQVILDEYGRLDYHREVARVQLAALKLADGCRDRLRQEIEAAKSDFRDVLLSAEYPECAKRMFRIDRLSEEERAKIYEADWKQYEKWLKR